MVKRGLILAVASALNWAATPNLLAQPTPDAVGPATRPTAARRLDSPKHQTSASMPVKTRARMLAAGILYTGILFLVMFVGILAIVRFTKRFRAAVLKPDQTPTTYTDAWAMHQAPEVSTDEEDETR